MVGRCECFIWCGCRTRLAGVGRVGRVYAFCKCRVIPPIEMYLSPEPERHMGRSLQCYILTGYALYRGVIRRERPACRPAPPLTNRARSRTLKSLPPKLLQNSPHEHPHKPKRAKFPPCMGGCSWGKFGEDEGGLEGEGTPSERGSLLPPRSSSPYPSLLQKKP